MFTSVLSLRLMVFICFFTSTENASYKIVGGEDVKDIAEFSYVVAVNKATNIYENHCGGTIVKEDWILTAAHCLCYKRSSRHYKHDDFVVLVALISLKDFKQEHVNYIKSLHIHDEYDHVQFFNDIALLQLKEPVVLSAKIKLVNLPYVELFKNTYPAKLFKSCEAIGWGTVNPQNTLKKGTLKKVSLPLISNSECGRLYEREDINDNNVCTLYSSGGKDACIGDGGGPLICYNLQIGIISWGKTCAEPNKPGVYIRVDKYVNWIKYEIKNNISKISDSYHLLIISLLFIIIIY